MHDASSFSFYDDFKGVSCLLLRGEWCPDTDRVLSDLEWEKLVLYAECWDSFEGLLPYLEKIKWLEIASLPKSIVGLDGLESIEILRMGEGSRESIDFRMFVRLRSLTFGWVRWMRPDFLDIPSLKNLSIHRFPYGDFSTLPAIPGLSSLELVSGKVRSLSGIGRYGLLRNLVLDRTREVSDVGEVEFLTSLSLFSGSGLVKLIDASPVICLCSLRELTLDAPKARVHDVDALLETGVNGVTLTCLVDMVDWGRIAKNPLLESVVLDCVVDENRSGSEIREVLESRGRVLKEFEVFPRKLGRGYALSFFSPPRTQPA